MLIWPKHIVTNFGGLISSDGSIKTNPGRITLFACSEEEWCKKMKKNLLEYRIGTSIVGPQCQNIKRFNDGIDIEKRFMYWLHLNKRFPKGKNGGMNQHQIFRNSIEHWGLHGFLMERKYEVLCRITNPLPTLEEPKTQQRM